MPTSRTKPKDIDEYNAAFPPEVQAILQRIRLTIHGAAPDAAETISYQIPAFTPERHPGVPRRLQEAHRFLSPGIGRFEATEKRSRLERSSSWFLARPPHARGVRRD